MTRTETEYHLQENIQGRWVSMQRAYEPYLHTLKEEKARRERLYPHEKLRIVKQEKTIVTTVIPMEGEGENGKKEL